LFDACYEPIKAFLHDRHGLPESASLALLSKRLFAADVPALGLSEPDAARLISELALLVSRVLAEVRPLLDELGCVPAPPSPAPPPHSLAYLYPCSTLGLLQRCALPLYPFLWCVPWPDRRAPRCEYSVRR
jgi:hypothetical protein